MEATPLYRPILKRAWQITKGFKGLWFFGLFAAIIGSSGEYEILFRATSSGTQNKPGAIAEIFNSLKTGWQNGFGNGDIWQNLWSAISASPTSLILAVVIVIVAVAIAIFLIWLSVISQIGIIKNIDLADKNKKITINGGIDFATKNFWPIILVDVALKIILFAFFIILGKELVLLATVGLAGRIIYLVSFVVFVIVTFIISFLVRYQIFYILFQKQKIMTALYSSWLLFKKNWLISIELAVILFVVYLVAIILTAIISVVLLAVPFVIPIYYAASVWLATLVSVIAFILLIAATFLITAVFTTFQWSAWTLLFNKLAGEGALSRLARSSQQVTDYFLKP